MELVVNEWLPEALKPEGLDKEISQADTLAFLEKFISNKDKIVVKNESAFEKKVHFFKKKYAYDKEALKLLKALLRLIQDEKYCRIVDESELASLPERINEKLNLPNTNYSSDIYLFEAASTTTEKTIITSDIKLVELFQEEEEYKVVHFDEFIKNY